MLHLLKRHPIPIKAYFRHSLVLTYAYPQEVLQRLLPPGLILDTFQNVGFLAIAMVQTEALRPAFLPAFMGKNFFLTGYRIFTRFKTEAGRTLRGLRILRSDTDQDMMVKFGNLLTHYHYRKAEVKCAFDQERMEIRIQTPHAEADLHVIAEISKIPAPLPEGSPFVGLEEARRFGGPLPFTFDYEKETHSIIRIEGVRKDWHPLSVKVDVLQNTFLENEPFRKYPKRLANAFYISGIPYMWKKGIREPLPTYEE